jgi:hypothetical protein
VTLDQCSFLTIENAAVEKWIKDAEKYKLEIKEELYNNGNLISEKNYEFNRSK